MNITSYSNMNDMVDALRHAMEAADSRVKNWQANIGKGACFIQESGYGFPIYGEVLEDAPSRDNIKNYRFCKCYSEACPEGEMGDVHVSVIDKVISRDEFNKALGEL